MPAGTPTSPSTPTHQSPRRSPFARAFLTLTDTRWRWYTSLWTWFPLATLLSVVAWASYHTIATTTADHQDFLYVAYRQPPPHADQFQIVQLAMFQINRPLHINQSSHLKQLWHVRFTRNWSHSHAQWKAHASLLIQDEHGNVEQDPIIDQTIRHQFVEQRLGAESTSDAHVQSSLLAFRPFDRPISPQAAQWTKEVWARALQSQSGSASETKTHWTAYLFHQTSHVLMAIAWLCCGCVALHCLLRAFQIKAYQLEVTRWHNRICPTCTYQICGLQTTICPECGRDAEHQSAEAIRIIKEARFSVPPPPKENDQTKPST